MREAMLLLVSLLGICSLAKGNIDSLEKQLSKHPYRDSVTAKILCELAEEIGSSDTATALNYIRSAVQIGEQSQHRPTLALAYMSMGKLYSLSYRDSLAIIAYRKGIKFTEIEKDHIATGKLYFNTGISHNYIGEPDAALDAFSNAIRNFKNTDKKDLLARAYYYKGMVFSGKSQPDSAIFYYDLAGNIYRQNDDRSLPDIYNSTGIEYLNQSAYSKALEQFLKALDLYETSANSKGTINALNNIGIVQKSIGNYKAALDYYKRSLRKSEETDNEVASANAMGNIGILYDLLHQPAEALQYFLAALKTGEQLENLTIISSNLNNAGTVYYEQGNYAQSMLFLKRSATILEKTQNQKALGEAYGYIGLICLKADDALLSQWGIAPKDKFSKALEYEKKALELARATDSPEDMSFYWNNIYAIHLAQGHYQEALEAYTTHILYKDSMALSDQKTEIARLEAQYEYQKKEIELKTRHEADISREKLIKKYALLALIVILGSGGLTFFFYKRNRDAVEKRKTAELNAYIAETEMKALRAQMNPHFIFNALSSISKYITANDAESADFYLSKFARLMRSILENSEHALIPLKEDLHTLKLYMDLEAERLNHKFSYEIVTDHQVDPEKTLVPPLIFQPFIENSIWHGISRLQEEKGQIKISFFKKELLLHCIIEDNGTGSNSIKENIYIQKQKSMGTRITASRIRIMNKFGVTIPDFQLNYTEKGTVVDIYLPHILADGDHLYE